MPNFDKVAIIGVGLLGGSIGKALQERELAKEVIGIGRYKGKLSHAQSIGTVTEATTDLAEGVAGANVVVVCTPVETVADQVAQVLEHVGPDCLVTDVGSTKEAIIRDICEKCGPRASQFVGSHPLAGDHNTGPDFSRADLFEKRMVVITPSDQNELEPTVKIAEFWHALGARTILLQADEHDAALAVTSHLPHALATALALTTPQELLGLAATGWADTTRVAAADSTLWRQIFLANREQVLAALDHFNVQLTALRTAIATDDGDKLEELLFEGKKIRDALGN
ncbi:prephenate dehydrogenase [Aeoliella mucimassa]|uniref:Prephenate dehydrogenase n=1 Tax=Aeoliella mucimassa TaxID=2527972 RepID=A0A518ASS2_9BACT|nr:prephenate dehydrogenase/arogenate dehydrogenase family protein [Aeoliella mucimassa]QDU57783.1 prephenate dehydrogenase [Aeoliella mucimassa]